MKRNPGEGSCTSVSAYETVRSEGQFSLHKSRLCFFPKRDLTEHAVVTIVPRLSTASASKGDAADVRLLLIWFRTTRIRPFPIRRVVAPPQFTQLHDRRALRLTTTDRAERGADAEHAKRVRRPRSCIHRRKAEDRQAIYFINHGARATISEQSGPFRDFSVTIFSFVGCLFVKQQGRAPIEAPLATDVVHPTLLRHLYSFSFSRPTHCAVCQTTASSAILKPRSLRKSGRGFPQAHIRTPLSDSLALPV